MNNGSFLDTLQKARQNAANSRQYDSDATRAELTKLFELACQGKSPFPWQLDITEALLLGLDCLLIAGTGAGKTMPMAMALLLPERKDNFIIVLSPLKDLQRDQVCPTSSIIYELLNPYFLHRIQATRFKEMGITATPVNQDNWSLDLHKVRVPLRFLAHEMY